MGCHKSLRNRGTKAWVLLLLLCAPLGCHSHYVNAAVENQTGAPVSPLEVDYPSASFGTESLRTGGTYTYRFKILGSGATKVTWTDPAHHDHTGSGPALHEGQEGTLRIVLTTNGASWTTALTP